MTLREVMGRAAAGAPDVEVRALALDDRDVEPGTVFFCVRGMKRDGHEFAAGAVQRGASALVVDHLLDGVGDVPQVVVDDVRAAMAPAAAALARDPTATLKTVGVTGTNGKTTSAYLIRSLLEAGGHPTGMLGTVTSVVGGHETPTVRTTPEAIALQRTFGEMLSAGDTHCVMEVSSHALSLHRASAIHWAAAVFTNLTQDHLDFHRDMDDYFAAKRELFVTAAGQGASLIVNIDDAHGAQLAAEFPQAVTVAIDAPDARLRATDIAFGQSGSTFKLDGVELSCPLPGRFNVLNALGAIAVARELGVDDSTIADALPTAGRAPGRFEPVDEGQDFAVIVDYAHTPDSLQNVLRAARSLTSKRVLVVFGAGGDRDRGKRPDMGAIAAEEADVVFVTSDNPRSEDPAAIVAEITGGIAAGAAGVSVELDRRRAIENAVAEATAGDVVVIAGKGHEQGQEFEDGRKLPFDDATVAREALRARLVAEQVAQAAGAELISAGDLPLGGPSRAVIDSREAGPEDLFVGLPGENVDGGRFASQALDNGAWGVLVATQHATAGPGVVLSAGDPLIALARLARAWRRELACDVIGVTGSVGKTTTKDLIAAMLAPALRVVANDLNFNTEIGLPLTILEAPAGTEALVLEMGMRGPGQIAELTAIAEPTVGVITALGPVHLEQMGSMEAIAAEKASLLAGLPHGAVAIVPVDEPLLDAHLREDLQVVRFGPGGDVDLDALEGLGLQDAPRHVQIDACAALAAARTVGVTPSGPLEVAISAGRGERIELDSGIVVIDDCYNANPVSMRAALDHLAATAGGRRIAVLGDMLELGPEEDRYHAEIGAHARATGVDLLIAVGPLSRAYNADHSVDDAQAAAALVPDLVREGDTVLVKASRGIGLETVVQALKQQP